MPILVAVVVVPLDPAALVLPPQVKPAEPEATAPEAPVAPPTLTERLALTGMDLLVQAAAVAAVTILKPENWVEITGPAAAELDAVETVALAEAD